MIWACLPLACLAVCLAYRPDPELMQGRAAELLLLLGASWAAWFLWRRPGSAGFSLPGQAEACAPRVLLLAALAWQALSLWWAPVREPGLVWLAERIAALALAAGLAAWWAGRGIDRRTLTGLAIAGLGILAIGSIAAGGRGETLLVGGDAPFGNPNFINGAALPLAVLAFGLSGRAGWILGGLAAAAIAALALGLGGGDPCRAAWLGLAAAAATAGILRLPIRWQLSLMLLGLGGLLLAQLTALAGWWSPDAFGASAGYRIALWRSGLEAAAGWHGLVGWGPGAALAVLPEQPSAAAAWLYVPSWAEHAHHEPIQAVLDGGLVGALLLLAAVVATLLPLWRRRGEPLIAALLPAWAAIGALALVESHLSQPGALLGLALLAGASWAVLGAQAAACPAGGSPLRHLVLLAPLPLAAAILWSWSDGGAPSMIVNRAGKRIAAIRTAGDWPALLEELDRLRARLGPLDWIDRERARCLGRMGRLEDSAAALAAHLRRLPCDPDGLALARRLREAGQATPDLIAALIVAEARLPALLSTVPAQPRTRLIRDRLAAP